MDLRRQLEHFRSEHDEFLCFLKEWENALTLAGRDVPETRCQGLSKLRDMEKKLVEIREHCRKEEHEVDSPFQIYLDDHALEELRREHDLLEQLTEGYRTELQVVTMPPPTTDLVGLGQRLLEQLRHHIAFEEGLLKQIEDGTAAEERVFLRYTQPAE